MNELCVEAKTENLASVVEFISGKLVNCPKKEQSQIAIAVEEIFVNIAHYAYSPGLGSVTIRVSVGDELVIEFEDSGKPYNPLEREDPDITKNAEDREVGGLGIFMVKKIMDAVEYRHEGGKNILVARKKLG